MPISSIDYSTMVPRSMEASTVAGKEANQLQNMMNAEAANFEKNVEQNSRRTVETAKSETDEYDYDDAGNKGSYSGQKKKKKKQKEAPMAPRSNSSFDIMI